MVDAMRAAGPGALSGAHPAAKSAPTANEPPPGDAPGFGAVLSAVERSRLDFSKHALRRIEERGLPLDGDRLTRLEAAVERAGAKGSRDSLILLDEMALVVSVRSQTVVTAMDESSSKEHVFTKIDSVVIAD